MEEKIRSISTNRFCFNCPNYDLDAYASTRTKFKQSAKVELESKILNESEKQMFKSKFEANQ